MIKLTELFGTRLILKIAGKQDIRKYNAVLSKNTIPHELAYRLTWFDKTTKPMGHIEMNRKNAGTIMSGKLPLDIQNRLHIYTKMNPNDIITIS